MTSHTIHSAVILVPDSGRARKKERMLLVVVPNERVAVCRGIVDAEDERK